MPWLPDPIQQIVQALNPNTPGGGGAATPQINFDTGGSQQLWNGTGPQGYGTYVLKSDGTLGQYLGNPQAPSTGGGAQAPQGSYQTGTGGHIMYFPPYGGTPVDTGQIDPSYNPNAAHPTVSNAQGIWQWDATKNQYVLVPNTGSPTTTVGGITGVDTNTAAQIQANAALAQAQAAATAANDAANRDASAANIQTQIQANAALASAQAAATAANQTNQQNWQGGQNAADRTQQAALQQQSLGFQGSLANANNLFTGGQNALNNQFSAGESSANRKFTSGESALDRALTAASDAANYAYQYQQAQQQAQKDALAAAAQYTQLSASPDLTGFTRFLAAGGGNAGNALQAGANSFTPLGQLGAARALEIAQKGAVNNMPSSFSSFYTPSTNPYADVQNPYVNSNPFLQYGAPGAAGTVATVPAYQAPPTPPAAAPVAQPAASAYLPPQAPRPATVAPQPAAQTPYPANQVAGRALYQAASPAQQAQTPATGAFYANPNQSTLNAANAGIMALFNQMGGSSTEGGASPAGFALGTKKTWYGADQPAADDYSPPQSNNGTFGAYALGTRPAYAKGTFIAGDSTDPSNPAAGGAHPEILHLEDPAGANNARATVTPMVPPGVGDTEGMGDMMSEPTGEPMEGDVTMGRDMPQLGQPDMQGKLGALFDAIGALLADNEKRLAWGTAPSYAYGTGTLHIEPKRGWSVKHGMAHYALGTDPGTGIPGSAITPGDQQYLNQNAQLRSLALTGDGGLPNVQSAQYGLGLQSPTLSSIQEANAQTGTGVPGSEFSFQAGQLAPRGILRNARFMDVNQQGW